MMNKIVTKHGLKIRLEADWNADDADSYDLYDFLNRE